MRFKQDDEYILNGNMSANITGDLIDIKQAYGISFQCSWVGTPTGNLQLQVSNDGVNWSNFGGTTATGGAAGSVALNHDALHFNFARLNFNFTGGAGTLQARLGGKGS
jgi:hypothetical protein